MPEQSGGGSPDPAPSSNIPSSDDGTSNNRRPRQRRRKKNPQSSSNQQKFKGKIEALSANVFDVSPRDADAFNTNLKEIAEYIARTVPNGGDFIKALDPDDLGFDANTRPPDPAANASVVEMEKWKIRYKNWDTKEQRRAETGKSAYAIILGQCSEALIERMETYPRFKSIKNQIDAIQLAGLIREAMYSGTGAKKPTISFLEAESSLIEFKQNSRMTTARYLETFKSKVEIFEHLGGEPGCAKARVDAQLEANGHDPQTATDHQRTAATAQARDKYLGNLFIMNSDPNRFVDLFADLRNGRARSKDSSDDYPSTLVKAYDILMTYEETSLLRRRHGQSSHYETGMSYNTDGTRPGRGRGSYGRGRGNRGGRGGRGNPPTADPEEDQAHATDANESPNGTDSIFEGDETSSADNNTSSPPKQYSDQCYSLRKAQRQNGSMFNTILMDSASTSNIIANKQFLTNIFRVEYPLVVNSLGGTKEIPRMGYFGEYPEPVWYHPDGGVNILSLNSVQHYYKCTMDTTKQNSIDVHLKNGTVMSFHASGKGLYRYELEPNESVHEMWSLVTMHPDLEGCVFDIDTVASGADAYTRRDYERAIRARRLQNIIMRPGNRKYKDICLGHLRRNPVTKADATAADDIFGPNLGSLKGKTVRRPNPHVPTGLDPVPPRILRLHKHVTLAIDIMFVNGIPFFITISRNLKFGTVEALPNRRLSTITDRLRSVIRLYRHRGFQINTILADHEFEPLRAAFPILNTCGADEHIPEIERYIRTIKDSTRSTYRMLPYTRVPRLVMIHLVKNAVLWYNAFPSSDGVSSEHSPRYLLTGSELSYDRHAIMEFGQYVQTHEEHTNDMRQRTLGAICLGPTGNQQGGHWFLSLTSGARITRHRWTILPAPREAINRINAIGTRQGVPSKLTYSNRHGHEIEDTLDDLAFDTDDDGSSYHPDTDSSTNSSATSTSSETDTSSDSDSTYSDSSDSDSTDSDDSLDPDAYPPAPAPPDILLEDPEIRAESRRPRRTTGVNLAPTNTRATGAGTGAGTVTPQRRVQRRVQIDPEPTTGVGNETTGVEPRTTGVEHESTAVESGNTGVRNETTGVDPDGVTVDEADKPEPRAMEHMMRYPEEQVVFEYPSSESDSETSTTGPHATPQSTTTTAFEQIRAAEQAGRDMAQDESITLPPRTSRTKSNKQNDYVYLSNASCAAEHSFNYLLESIEDLEPNQVFAVLMQPDVDSMFSLLTEQMSAKKGLRYFGQKGADAIKKELEQLIYRKVMHGKKPNELTREQKRAALRYLMFLKQKRCGRIKGRGCADGRKQRIYKTKNETSSPTIHIESLFLSAIIDAIERRYVATMDIPGAFMQANIDEIIHVKLVGEIADLLIRVDPSYEQFLTFEGGQRVIYTELDKALYGTLQAALLFWKKLTAFLSNKLGFIANPYDSCVMNKVINGKQMTIGWHVDDLKLSHVEADEVEKVIDILNKEFGKEAPLTVTRGKVHEYLGMTIDYSETGKVKFSMFDYVDRLVNEIPDDLQKGPCATVASNHLFNTNDNAEKLDPATSVLYHHLTAQLLYLGKRTRPDLLTAVSFLCTRVQAPDVDDWKKLGRCLRFLRDTRGDPFTLEADGMTKIFWWIDASFAVHSNMRSHTGATMSMGRGCPINISTKQKINTRSSTEAEVVGVNDAMYLVTWVRHFLEAQGYDITDNIVYQDNQSAILLEKNGRRSSTKNTRHMDIRYFFITDHIDRDRLSVEYCPTDDMLADFFTKPTQGSKHRNFRHRILNLPSDPNTVSQECVGASANKDEMVATPEPGNELGRANRTDVISTGHHSSDMRLVRGSYLAAAKGLLNRARKMNNVHLSHSIQQTVLSK